MINRRCITVNHSIYILKLEFKLLHYSVKYALVITNNPRIKINLITIGQEIIQYMLLELWFPIRYVLCQEIAKEERSSKPNLTMLGRTKHFSFYEAGQNLLCIAIFML